MSNPIVIKFQFQAKDIIALYLHDLNRQLVFKIMKILAAFSCLIMLLLITAPGSDFSLSMFILFWTLIFGFLLIPAYAWLSAKHDYKANPVLREKREYTIDTKNVKIKGETFDVSLEWNKIVDLSENKNYIFIWQTPTSAHIIPKDLLKSDELSFLQTIKEKHFSKK